MGKYQSSFQSTAERFLMLLKTNGPQSATALAKELGITSEGARLHLLKLQEEGFVTANSASKGVGRPTQLWSLTEIANRRFPDTHATLTVQLIKAIEEVSGPEALDKVLFAREKMSSYKYEIALSGLPSLEEKINKFAEIRTNEGYLAEWKKEDDGGYFLIENHCPICDAARACQSICNSELQAIRKIFGDDVAVNRVDHVLEGDRRCAYHIIPVAEKVS
ncbi:putative ArsR family transcriptional regulator [Chitinophaga skermanii]|uniref:Putative ArsR family transcriptional regulator n=1 Tax=Chitinophaga skermanii TaxID=331697 RepID=A0A327QSU1_9BACT|nr:metalloregulator ArsR/SmtB family transcription factor [Chitinophaga skermanii]RAJ06704.1 putative ArsR family transcriptional regulator [Chitinophaga skermanii]